MSAHKLSISLPEQQYEIVESYRKQHHYKTHSDVIKQALHLFQQIQLETSYREASEELDTDFDATLMDG